MKILKNNIITVASLFLLTAAQNSFAASCGNIQIAEMNWASAELMANVDKLILEEGYGCSIELVPGATSTTFASMNEKGQPGVAPELWINAIREPLDKALKAGSMVSVNNGPITDLGEGWWISPETVKKHPELTSVQAVLERPDLFPDKEDASKGAFVGCPAGWGCQAVNINLFRAFDMEAKGWKLVDPGSAAGLDGSMTKAVERSQNWLGYYWSPTTLIGKHNMTKLDWGVPFAGKDNWDNCIAKAASECEKPKQTAWSKSEVFTVVTDDAKKTMGSDASNYFSKRVFPGAVMNQMLVYMDDNQADGADAAIEFMQKHEGVWKDWVSDDTAQKIKKAL